MKSRAMWVRTTVLVCLSLAGGCGHPSDKVLAENFRKNEALFDKLLHMLLVDAQLTTVRRNLVRSGTTTLESPPSGLDRVGLSAERYAEYLNLFDQLGLRDGVGRGDHGEVWFNAEHPSLFNWGPTKGYVYSASELTPLVPDLDSYSPQSTVESRRPPFLVYRALKTHWHLYKNSD
jgi:hypothetical protein